MQLPEKLRWADDVSEAVCKLGTKINQLIDYLEVKENFHSETKELPYYWKYDHTVNAGYLYVGNKRLVAKTVPLKDNLNLDLDETGKVVGVEFLGETKEPMFTESQVRIYPLDIEEKEWGVLINKVYYSKQSAKAAQEALLKLKK